MKSNDSNIERKPIQLHLFRKNNSYNYLETDRDIGKDTKRLETEDRFIKDTKNSEIFTTANNEKVNNVNSNSPVSEFVLNINSNSKFKLKNISLPGVIKIDNDVNDNNLDFNPENMLMRKRKYFNKIKYDSNKKSHKLIQKERIDMLIKFILYFISNLVNIISIIIYIIKTYFEKRKDVFGIRVTNALQTMELITCFYFIFEYVISFIRAKKIIKHILSFNTLIDVITVVPSIVSYFFIVESNVGQTYIRVLRLFRVFRILRIYKSLIMIQNENDASQDNSDLVNKSTNCFSNFLRIFNKNTNPISLQIVTTLVILFCMFFICSGIVLGLQDLFENAFNIDDMEFFDAFYFIIITCSSTGYGEIVPTHPASRFFIICMIFSLIGIISNQLTKLSYLFAIWGPGLLNYTNKNHIIVICDKSIDLRLFLIELKKNQLEKEIIIISNSSNRLPSDGYPYNNIKLITVSTVDLEVLERANIKAADSIFIFSNKTVRNCTSTEKVLEFLIMKILQFYGDANIYVQTLYAIKSFENKIIKRNLNLTKQKETIKHSIQKSIQNKNIFRILKLKSLIITKTLYNVGFATFIQNILFNDITTNYNVNKYNTLMNNYLLGCEYKIHIRPFPPFFYSKTFNESCLQIYSKSINDYFTKISASDDKYANRPVLLLGVIETDKNIFDVFNKNKQEIYIFPGSYIISDTTLGIFISYDGNNYLNNFLFKFVNYKNELLKEEDPHFIDANLVRKRRSSVYVLKYDETVGNANKKIIKNTRNIQLKNKIRKNTLENEERARFASDHSNSNKKEIINHLNTHNNFDLNIKKVKFRDDNKSISKDSSCSSDKSVNVTPPKNSKKLSTVIINDVNNFKEKITNVNLPILDALKSINDKNSNKDFSNEKNFNIEKSKKPVVKVFSSCKTENMKITHNQSDISVTSNTSYIRSPSVRKNSNIKLRFNSSFKHFTEDSKKEIKLNKSILKTPSIPNKIKSIENTIQQNLEKSKNSSFENRISIRSKSKKSEESGKSDNQSKKSSSSISIRSLRSSFKTYKSSPSPKPNYSIFSIENKYKKIPKKDIIRNKSQFENENTKKNIKLLEEIENYDREILFNEVIRQSNKHYNFKIETSHSKNEYFIENRIYDLEKVNITKFISDHIVIIGYQDYMFKLIKLINLHFPDRDICIITSPELNFDIAIMKLLKQFNYLIHLKGEAQNPLHLENAGVNKAYYVIFLVETIYEKTNEDMEQILSFKSFDYFFKTQMLLELWDIKSKRLIGYQPLDSETNIIQNEFLHPLFQAGRLLYLPHLDKIPAISYNTPYVVDVWTEILKLGYIEDTSTSGNPTINMNKKREDFPAIVTINVPEYYIGKEYHELITDLLCMDDPIIALGVYIHDPLNYNYTRNEGKISNETVKNKKKNASANDDKNSNIKIFLSYKRKLSNLESMDKFEQNFNEKLAFLKDVSYNDKVTLDFYDFKKPQLPVFITNPQPDFILHGNCSVMVIHNHSSQKRILNSPGKKRPIRRLSTFFTHEDGIKCTKKSRLQISQDNIFYYINSLKDNLKISYTDAFKQLEKNKSLLNKK